ncbi:MAG: kynurenine formamidase [bacterium]|nr:kynurenine formamidase [bacterium]
MLYDISPPIDAALQVWPGDVPPTREVLADMAAGDAVTSSALRATAHLGAHADAPSHVGRDAPTIDQQSLELYLGPCQVIRVKVGHGSCITPELVPTPIDASRVLFATGTYPDPTRFNEDFAGLAPETVDWLHERGVRLIGIDTPSIDVYTATELPAHHRLLHNSMASLEGLQLDEVPEGRYELIALPLRLVGFDASPVRAVLRTFN